VLNFDITQLLTIALRTLIIYFFVLIGLRLSGKREVGQMTPFDLVLLILLANTVQNAMTGPDTSLTGGIVAALTLLIVNFLVAKLTFSNKQFRHVVEGSPTILVRNGQVLIENVKTEEITNEDIMQALREHGIEEIADVALAVLEIDGSISVLKSDEMPTVSRPHHRIKLLKRGK
jgi:uncharacterized membrane protein YcaP (DUF421 family)